MSARLFAQQNGRTRQLDRASLDRRPPAAPPGQKALEAGRRAHARAPAKAAYPRLLTGNGGQAQARDSAAPAGRGPPAGHHA